jgi:hypothetical protein
MNDNMTLKLTNKWNYSVKDITDVEKSVKGYLQPEGLLKMLINSFCWACC